MIPAFGSGFEEIGPNLRCDSRIIDPDMTTAEMIEYLLNKGVVLIVIGEVSFHAENFRGAGQKSVPFRLLGRFATGSGVNDDFVTKFC